MLPRNFDAHTPSHTVLNKTIKLQKNDLLSIAINVRTTQKLTVSRNIPQNALSNFYVYSSKNVHDSDFNRKNNVSVISFWNTLFHMQSSRGKTLVNVKPRMTSATYKRYCSFFTKLWLINLPKPPKIKDINSEISSLQPWLSYDRFSPFKTSEGNIMMDENVWCWWSERKMTQGAKIFYRDGICNFGIVRTN
jgi:hypothetical protein